MLVKVRQKRPLESLARELKAYIRARPHTTKSLARELRVSTATISRALVILRRLCKDRGYSLVSVKDGKSWHYEITSPPNHWMKDGFYRAVGLVPGVPRSIPKSTGYRPPGQSEDAALYPDPNGSE